ncbi:MAG TPA: radical SAM protein [Cytophagales bacterium]|nr:radical SAM protein [Cytophagales bacterium]
MRARIKDGYNFMSKLSLNKVLNFSILLLSYYISKFLKKDLSKGMPFSISIEPTTSCNLRCPECPSGLRSFTRPTGMLTDEVFTKVIDELGPTLTYLIFYFQGEPYLNPNFLKLVRYAHDKKIYTATSTNAHYLNSQKAEETVRSGLDRLIISIDGTTQDTYESYRVGGSLDKVLEGTKNIIAAKRKLKSAKPYVIFQFLVVKPNEHQIAEVYNLAREYGVDEVKLKTAQIYDYEKGSDLIPEQGKYARYKKNQQGEYTIKNALEHSCWKMWHGAVVTWDGKVVPCCFDKDATHQLGSVAHTSFKQVWHSAAYRHFRQSIIKSRSEIEICKNCTEGTKVFF